MTDGRSGAGTSRGKSLPTTWDDALVAVWRVLNRSHPIDSVTELYNGLDQVARRPPLPDTQVIAFGFDTNAMYRVALNGTRGDDAIDFLRTQHKAPVVVPGQAIQEVWNNLLAGVEPQAKRVRKKFEELQQETASIDQRLGESGEAVLKAVDDLLSTHGEWIDPAAHESFSRTVEVLMARGLCAYVPRTEFYDLARVRKETKTPPGYQDQLTNHGDFFVWADYLYGLAQSNLDAVDAVVLVTNDVKPDWTRNGVAHPLLVTEAQAVTGLPFRLWTVNDFQSYVKRLGS